MILKKASKKAIKYACLNFHYAKSVPVNTFGFAVFNNKKEWCGVILYGLGANNNLAKSFNMVQGQVIELVRMALNGKQESTSKCMAISIKLLKKCVPNAKLIVSYADEKQNHKGIIYQATNWYYAGAIQATSAIDPQDGEIKHTRILHSKYGSIKGFKKVKDKLKHKYIFPLNKSIRKQISKLSKQYPKKLCPDGENVSHLVTNKKLAVQI